MKSSALLFCVVAFLTLVARPSNADDAIITLDLNYSSGTGSAGTWQLLGRIDDTASGADGQFGFLAVRSLLDQIEFGTNGDAISLASGIGAIQVLGENTVNERPAIVQQTGGTIDLTYFQDLSESETFPGSGLFHSVVPFVGNGGDTLLASGSFIEGLIPAFGLDNTSSSPLPTQALFLSGSTSPYSNAVNADNTFTLVTDNLLTGDYNGDGSVDAADYTVWRDSFNSTTELAADGSGNGLIDDADYDVWVANYGNALSNANSSTTSVPEPSALILLLSTVGLLFRCRQ